MFGPDGRCFLAARGVSKSVLAVKHDRSKPKLSKRKVVYSFRSSATVYLPENVLFRTGQCLEKISFLGHIANKFRRPIILQLNVENLTASKMNVLHYLTLQFEALFILLQETHCTSTEKSF